MIKKKAYAKVNLALEVKNKKDAKAVAFASFYKT